MIKVFLEDEDVMVISMLIDMYKKQITLPDSISELITERSLDRLSRKFYLTTHTKGEENANR